jgi:predicted ATPase
MRLSRIEIKNFKGIGRRQAIDLKPITLLFGPNSVGKSTILQALHYLREILGRGNIDPDVTIAGGLIVVEHDKERCSPSMYLAQVLPLKQIAAANTRRQFVGIEKDAEFFGTAVEVLGVPVRESA